MAEKKKGKRMVDTNVRVTKLTHQRLRTLADLWGTTMSEAIDTLIERHVPEVNDEIRRRDETKRKLAQKSKQADDE